MDEKDYKVTIVLYVMADNEAQAYNEACKEIKAERLSRELCTIKLDE